jgi:hypothetical protein
MHLDWQRNLGNTDRMIRTIIGFLLIILVSVQVITGGWAILAVLFAIFQFVEAFFAY